jgi:hypothetical protein
MMKKRKFKSLNYYVYTTNQNRDFTTDFKMASRLPLGFVQHRTYANPPPKAHTQKPNGGGYA